MNTETVIVGGLARSGLSLTMQMLHAGGFPCFGRPPAFEDCSPWRIPWSDLAGRAVKIVDLANFPTPPAGAYAVIRLRRDLRQQARSFNKFTRVMLNAPPIQTSRLVRSFEADYKKIDRWIARQRRDLRSDGSAVVVTAANPDTLHDAVAEMLRGRPESVRPDLFRRVILMSAEIADGDEARR